MLDIQVLVLPKKNLSEVPLAAWEAADITTLDLTQNQIKALPTELSMCSALEVR
jgi:Leucine-rich repeat (LRR) protein